jgi:hypothetical protein
MKQSELNHPNKGKSPATNLPGKSPACESIKDFIIKTIFPLSANNFIVLPQDFINRES